MVTSQTDSETHRRRDKPDTRATENWLETTTTTDTFKKKKSVTYTVKQPGKGTRPYCNICLPPLQIAPLTR